MSRLFVACAVVAVALGLSQAQQPKPPEKPVEITWHGQSFFTVKSSKGTMVAFDPHLIPAYGRPIKLKADLVFMSHLHTDHIQLDVFDNKGDFASYFALKDDDEKQKEEKKKFKVRAVVGLKGSGSRTEWNIVNDEFKDVSYRSIGVYHDNEEGLKAGKNAIFVIEVDGWKICHLGDLGHKLSKQQIKELGSVDVLMIPVGGVYTLNGADAKKVADQIKAKEYILPMHYGTDIFDDVLTADEFMEHFDSKEVIRMKEVKDNKLVLNRDARRPRPLLVQLHYWPKATKVE